MGGGPAGMSAAYYLARMGYGVTVLEAMPVPGGMMAIGIPEYRLPREVLREEIDRIVGLGVELRLDAVMGRDYTLNDLETQGFKAVFLATGAPKSRRLGVPGDDLRGVIPGTVFLKQVNLGEKPRLAGRVVVVGGGSTAMDAARSALRSGADVGHRPVPAWLQGDARPGRGGRGGPTRGRGASGSASRSSEVVGVDGRVTGLRVTRAGADRRRRGRTGRLGAGPGSEAVVAADVILVAIGEEPDPSILPEGAGIETSAWAGIAADPRTLATGRRGVFAGGDVVTGPKTIIDAVAAGRRAAGRHPRVPGRGPGRRGRRSSRPSATGPHPRRA